MGLITTVDLESSLYFGPLPVELMIADPAYLVAHSTMDQLSDLPTIYLDPKRVSEPIRLIEWICNIRCARFPEEQNLELCQSPCHNVDSSLTSKNSSVFYRTTRLIRANEELLLWYSKQDIQHFLAIYFQNSKSAYLQLDQLCTLFQNKAKNSNPVSTFDQFLTCSNQVHHFKCVYCHIEFIYIYPFIAHLVFKCPAQSIPTQLKCSFFNKYKPKLCPQTSINLLLHHYQQKLETNGICLAKPLAYNSDNDLFVKNNLNLLLSSSSSSSSSTLSSDLILPLDLKKKCSSPIPTLSIDSPKFSATCPQTVKLNKSVATILASVHKKYFNKSKFHGHHSKVKPVFQNHNTIGEIGTTHKSMRIKKSKLKSNASSLKTLNPLVEKMLKTLNQSTVVHNTNKQVIDISTLIENPDKDASLMTSLSVVQNWCASCCISFRLTSDLVQHMRTHHNDRSAKSNDSRHTKLNSDRWQMKTSQSSIDHASTNNTYLNLDTFASTKMKSNGIDSQHAANLFACTLCNEVFDEKYQLMCHMMAHT